MAVRTLSFSPFSPLSAFTPLTPRFLSASTTCQSSLRQKLPLRHHEQSQQPQTLHHQQQHRQLHGNRTRDPADIPQPTPFVPDPQTFLSLIGRGMSKHASKFTSWADLFLLDGKQLKELGIEPTRSRRYLLHWRHKFRQGKYGLGGDFDHVVDGVAHLRLVQVPRGQLLKQMRKQGMNKEKFLQQQQAGGVALPDGLKGTATLKPGMKWAVINLPPDAPDPDPWALAKPLKKYKEVVVRSGGRLAAPFLKLVKGTEGRVGTVSVQEGLWEEKLGTKVDGGERRRAEVRAKRRSEERKKAA
ncbi:hypothetical protein AJ79_00175 [Helicocarpus griseus UAMH5409]|uniref:Small ribosomal subunit protein mS41 n=1 Tax=Helicocarpus griseus UAMH5409 TaxID=1447875 RepID=A0A2B7YD16_9EURO|nr:hypothetical protein AJ79_00175 [Helicocarpus griseus UAMH5409]